MSVKVRLTACLAAIPIIALALVGGYYGRATAGEETYRHLRVFEDVVSLISSNYVEPVDLDDVLQGALRGLTDGLDADSAYLSPAEADRLEQDAPLPPGRIGVTTTRRYYLQVVAARDGSPAAEAGIMAGDYIRAIDGEPTRRLSAIEGERRLRGAPGAEVTLSLIRGSTQEPYDISLVRAPLAPAPVSGRMLDDAADIGYLRIPAFAADTAAAVAETAAALARTGAAHLIVDIRNTAEGAYEDGIETARLFVDDGPLVVLAEQGGTQTTIRAEAPAVVTLPVTLLINFGSAGPAELFAAALTARGAATVIGQRTYGRTGRQRLVRLPDGSGLWLSWARYLTADGEAIHPFGIQPAIEVTVTLPELGEPLPDRDAVLDRAIAEITGGAPAQAARRDAA